MLAYSEHDPEHITAILGQEVHFNCHAHFPGDIPVPYVVTWSKKGNIVSSTAFKIILFKESS